MKPTKEGHPDIPKRIRGRQKEPLKAPVSIRLNPDVVEYFKSQGKGWQTKINNIIHNYMKTNRADRYVEPVVQFLFAAVLSFAVFFLRIFFISSIFLK